MACATCDYTMQQVNNGAPKVFWCPRCGTLKTEQAVPEFVEPKLVEYAATLCQAVLLTAPGSKLRVIRAVQESVAKLPTTVQHEHESDQESDAAET